MEKLPDLKFPIIPNDDLGIYFYLGHFSTKSTGLPMPIYLIENINTDLGNAIPRMFVLSDYKPLNETDKREWFSVTLNENPKVFGNTGQISNTDIQLILKWTKKHLPFLLDYWNSNYKLPYFSLITNELANLKQDQTNLPMNLFSGSGTNKHSPRIKVQGNTDRKVRKDLLFSVSLNKNKNNEYECWNNSTSKLSTKDMKALFTFIDNNAELLIDHYHGLIDNEILLSMMKPNQSDSLFESINLYDKVMLLGEAKAAELVSGIQWAYDTQLNGVLVGGTAVVHYLRGGRDLTPDADYMVQSISDIKTKLDELDERWDDIIGVDGDVIGITALDRNTDFLDPNKAGGNRTLNRAIIADPVIAMVAGRQVKMICPELLAIMKLELGREKDTNDGFALLMSGKVNQKKYVNYVEALGNTLQDKIGLLSYSELIP